MRATNDMKVSVIVPTRNRPAALRQCLEALAESTLESRSFEILVVDDGGEQPLTEAVSPVQERLALSVLHQPHLGPATARNRGASRAAAPLLAFTDDDCQPSATWLAEILKFSADAPTAMIGGSTENGVHDNAYSEASQLLIRYLYESYLQPSGEPKFFTSNNLAVPASGFAEIGGFDERFPDAAAEDRELCMRWSDSSRPMLFAPDARVMHFHTLGLLGFARQHFAYGRGAHLCRSACETGSVPRPKLEHPAFYLRLMNYPRLGARSSRPKLMTLLFALSQAVNTAGFAFEAISSHLAARHPGAKR